MKDSMKWTSNITIEKYNNDESYKKGTPDDVVKVNGNTALTLGLQELWKLVTGQTVDDGVYPLNADNTYIGVGNSAVTAEVSQTGLIGAQQAYVPMDQSTGDTYPIIEENVLVLRSVFGPTVANFTWNEWGVFNGNPAEPGTREASTIIMFNRKVEAMGTKSSGATWVLVANLSILP